LLPQSELKNMAKLAIKKMNTSDDFLTPPEVVAAMGQFDLDPCSSRRQEQTLARRTYCFPDDDGLMLPWEGSVFVNPPFSELRKWINRFVLHANGVLLVPARIEVAWFWSLWTHCDGFFFTKGPVKYLCPAGKTPPRFFRRRVLRGRQRECGATS
jgi:DNA N-6-adenine-methyltransferase (Dam)